MPHALRVNELLHVFRKHETSRALIARHQYVCVAFVVHVDDFKIM